MFSTNQIEYFLGEHPMKEDNYPLWYSYSSYLSRLTKRDAPILSKENNFLCVKKIVCPKCGRKIVKFNFCPHCGQRVREVSEVDLGEVTISAAISEVKA